jgi:hypothetical protein
MGFYRSLTTSRRGCVDPCRHTRREGAAAAVAHARRRSTEAERQLNRGCADRRRSSLRDDAETAAAARNQMEGARRLPPWMGAKAPSMSLRSLLQRGSREEMPQGETQQGRCATELGHGIGKWRLANGTSTVGRSDGNGATALRRVAAGCHGRRGGVEFPACCRGEEGLPGRCFGCSLTAAGKSWGAMAEGAKIWAPSMGAAVAACVVARPGKEEDREGARLLAMDSREREEGMGAMGAWSSAGRFFSAPCTGKKRAVRVGERRKKAVVARGK